MRMFRKDTPLTLLQGDCLERMRDIPAGSVDMVLADPPYATTECEWDKPLDWAAVWSELRRVCKTNAAMVLFSAQPFTTDLVNSNRKEFRYDLIFEKERPTGFMNAPNQPLRAHENLCVFFRAKPTYTPQKTPAKRQRRTWIPATRPPGLYGKKVRKMESYDNEGMAHPRSILPIVAPIIPDGERVHTSQKSLGICEYLILTYSKEGDMVLDFTCGSASTLIAAANVGRPAIGIEREPDTYKIADERLRAEGIPFAETLGEKK